MKSPIFYALSLAGLVTPAAYGLSLYDTAPPIGLPESHAVQYSANISLGWNDNLNSTKHNRKSGGYVSFGVGASYADYESVTKINYSANIGGTLYNKEANGTDQQLFSNISLAAHLSHAFSAGSSYSMGLTLRYTPEPDYSNGISAARNQGDCLNWSISNAYSQSIDSRWSWSVNASFSGNIYTQSAYKIDDRQYINGGLSLNYRYSNRTSYSLSTSGRYELRTHGFDSESLYVTGSMSHSLSPVSSMSISAGGQAKFIDGQTDFYPNIRFGYNRRLTDGLSMSSYLSLDNENVGTYNHIGNYLSDLTWRLGADMSYRFTHRVSFSFGASLLDSSYSKGTNGLGKVDRTTWTAHVGMSYMFTTKLSGSLTYTYTHASGSGDYGYYRNNISAGLSYAF